MVIFLLVMKQIATMQRESETLKMETEEMKGGF